MTLRLSASDRSYFTIKTNYRGRGRPLYYMRGFHAVAVRCEGGSVPMLSIAVTLDLCALLCGSIFFPTHPIDPR